MPNNSIQRILPPLRYGKTADFCVSHTNIMDDLTQQVIDFVATFAHAAHDDLSLNATLFGDLGIDGDDAVDFLQQFSNRFGVAMEGVKVNHYFGPEGRTPWFFVNWLSSLFRSGSPEQKAGLIPITIRDLITSTKDHRWSKRG